eukprot:TRINITY_DN17346_c0_g1_i1.p1 TRINITY_DN17346_c0_g1~~TRINITY_DN17346_c0_g1_i1.p1  ORF type:complete len:304 (+),score=94.51 TRINITY_DN17346_c0_g1_i1:74-985(+)
MDVSSILSAPQKLIEVEKDGQVDYDLGNLAIFDLSAINPEEYREDPEVFLKSLARDNMQLLINNVFGLPSERDENGVIAKLPTGTTVIPREKPVPKPKPLTKWEKFALEKGIVKTKKSRREFDENTGKDLPRWGYNRAKRVEDDWVIEHKPGMDTSADAFEERSKKKKEKIDKQKDREERNVRNALKLDQKKAAHAGITTKSPSTQQLKSDIEAAIESVKKSTASLGKFNKRLSYEPETKQKNKRQKFEPVASSAAKEKDSNMQVLSRLLGSEGARLDRNKAANQYIGTSQKPTKKDKGGKKK